MNGDASLRRRRNARAALAGAILATAMMGAAALGKKPEADAALQSGRYALLVGCTEYPNNPRLSRLTGPENDVRLFAELLTSPRFGFPGENVIQLMGWPDDESARPTLANITAALERLIERARPGDQIVILLAGHGTQHPIPEDQEDPFDPANPEPDGMDEYFLPADVGEWSQDAYRAGHPYPNALRDNTIGEWLDRLQERGASVWIIFDCCHAGTMTRSAGDVEVHRGVHPSELGVPREVLEEARRKVERAMARQPGPPHGETARGTGAPGTLTAPPVRLAAEGHGSLVAFYAAQPYEETPEMPWPSPPRTDDNVYGLLSYFLAGILEQSEGTMTYRDLARRLVGHYRADRGSRGPTPLFDGDLDREVLGTDLGPRVPIYLDRTAEGVRLSAGAMVGLTPGTILAVHPPGGAALEEGDELGHVRVTAVTPLSAEVESIAFGEDVAGKTLPAVPLAEFPDAARCRIVVRDLGDMAVTVFLAGRDDDTVLFARLEQAVNALPEDVAELVRVIDDPAQAEWVLRVAGPETARREFVIDDVAQPQIFLLAGSGREEAPATKEPAALKEQVPAREDQATAEARRRVYQRYDFRDADRLAGALGADLLKIFAWQNIWRMAPALEENVQGDIEFEVVVLDSPEPADDDAPAATAAGHVLRPGTRIELRLANRGHWDQWVTLLNLDGNYGIQQLISVSIPAQKDLQPLQGDITDASFGPQGFVLMSVGVREHRHRPNYDFLVQESLGGATRGRTRQVPQNPFERLMQSIAGASDESVRSFAPRAPTTPRVQAWTWVTIPER